MLQHLTPFCACAPTALERSRVCVSGGHACVQLVSEGNGAHATVVQKVGEDKADPVALTGSITVL